MAFASEELRGDAEVVREAVRQDGWALECAAASFQEDRETVLEAVRQDGWVLELAAESLRADREVVLAAVGRANSLRYAADELRGDREVALAAVAHSPEAYKSVSAELQTDSDFIASAVARGCLDVLKFLPRELLGHDLMLQAVRANPYALKLAPPDLLKDREIVATALKQDGRLMELVAEEFRADGQLVLWAAEAEVRDHRTDRVAFTLAAEELFSNPQFMVAAAKLDARVLMKAPPELRANREFMLHCVKENYLACQFASPELQADRAFTKACTELNQKFKSRDFLLALGIRERARDGDRESARRRTQTMPARVGERRR